MGGSKKMQQVRSIANRPQGGGNKKQGLPPSIGRAGWFSNFIRTHAGGYFRSIPAAAAAAVAECIKGAIWVKSGQSPPDPDNDHDYIDITSDDTGQYVWAISNDGNVGEVNILLRSTDYGVTFTNFQITSPATIDDAAPSCISVCHDDPEVVCMGTSLAPTTLYYISTNANAVTPTFAAQTDAITAVNGFTAIDTSIGGVCVILAGPLSRRLPPHVKSYKR